MALLTTQIGGLTCRVFQQSDEPPTLAVVLCHGFGAPGDDLVSLAPELVRIAPRLARARFVFPAAPLSLSGMMPSAMGDSRAWWMLDLERLIAVRMGQGPDTPESLRAQIPDGLPAARKSLMGLAEAVLRAASLSPSQLVLGGFSQGAMLATDVTFRLEEAPAALVVLSGTLVAEPEWRVRAPRRRGLRVLQTHGSEDPILPFDNAEALRDLLTQAGLTVDFLPFPGGHTIPLEALQRLAQLLSGMMV
jgi:phospholipase/carboxylesterase